MTQCNHYYEEFPIGSLLSTFKCNKCGDEMILNTRYHHLKSGKIMRGKEKVE